MTQKKLWQMATILVSAYLMLTVLPEVRMLGFMVLSLGLDTLILLIGLQVMAVSGLIYRQQLLPAVKRINAFFEKHDPFFFIPSSQQLKRFPVMTVHAVPFLLTGYVLVFSAEAINDV